MPVMNKHAHKNIMTELEYRWAQLNRVLESRPLHSAREGCKGRTHWVEVDRMCATTGSASAVRLAVDDFLTILKEIRSATK